MSPSFTYVFIFAFMLVVLIVPIHGLRRLIRDLSCLKTQLQQFSVRDAVCFCCTHLHVHPETTATIPCDRELVYATIKQWQVQRKVGSSCLSFASDQTFLDAFDMEVRTVFAPVVTKYVGGTRISYLYCLVLGVPCLWFALDMPLELGATDVLRRGINYLSTFLFAFPCGTRMMLKTAEYSDRLLGILQNIFVDVCWTVIASFLFFVAWSLCFYIPLIAAERSFVTIVPQLIVMGFHSLVTLAVFRAPFCHFAQFSWRL